MSEPTYLSALSANALISDLRPTTLSPITLTHVNYLLDELLISLLKASQSINPFHLRREGIPTVFSADKTGNAPGESTGVRALGRSAVAEAEVELRSWYEGRAGSGGFPPGGQGAGTRSERAFPLDQAVALMRLKCVSFSTLAPQEPAEESEEAEVLAAWRKAGGDVSDDTIEPAGLWMTAILEHVCEHVLAQLSRVVSRDSGITVAGPQDLYTALCEDESVWGFFKKMKVKEQLESAIRTGSRPKRSTPARSSPGGRDSPSSHSQSPLESKTSLVSSQRNASGRDGSFEAPGGVFSSVSGSDVRTSSETSRFVGITGGITRKGSALSRKGAKYSPSHERSGSVLSDNTRSMIGAFNQTLDDEEQERAQSPQEAQDEFDRLVRSGETMKVSLTPSRLKNFEPTPSSRRKASDSPNNRSSPLARSHAHGNSVASLPVNPRLAGSASAPDGPDSETRPSSSARPSPAFTANGRPRADSAQRKLVARGATTIEEKSEEDDDDAFLSGAPTSKKESLMELLASDDMFGPIEETDKKSGQGEKRTVPAVVLGTPPPPQRVPDQRQPQLSSPPLGRTKREGSGSTNSENVGSRRGSGSVAVGPNGRRPSTASTVTVTGAEASAAARSRRRTEAQELAEFFNSTAPPPPLPATANFDEDPPHTAKSGKSFRSLVARVTGSKKKEEEKEKERLAASASFRGLSSLASENGYPDPTLQARRQKSMQSMASAPAYRGHEGLSRSARGSISDDPPFVPQKDVLQKKQHGGSNKIAAMLDGDASVPPSTSRLDEESVSPRKGRVAVPPIEQQSIDRQPPSGRSASGGRTANRGSPRASPPLVAAAAVPTEPAASFSTTDRSRDVGRNAPVQDLVADEALPSLGPAVKALPLPPSRPPMAAPSPSDGQSFQTANEGEDRTTYQDDTDTAIVSNGQTGMEQTTPTVSADKPETSSSLAEPSIPLSELVPLRRLFDHATSARECRLLLSAILTQYGVPLSDASQPSEAPMTPEHRVTAWLLAGRDGPVSDYLGTRSQPILLDSNGANKQNAKGESEGEAEQDGDDLITPTEALSHLAGPTTLDEPFTPSHSASDSISTWSGEEELLTESEADGSTRGVTGQQTQTREEEEEEDGEGRITPTVSPRSKARVSVVQAQKGERSSPVRYVAGEQV